MRSQIHTVKIYLAAVLLSFATQNGLAATPPGQSRICVNLSREYDLESPIESLHLERTPAKPMADKRFADLTRTNASKAKDLKAEGLVIGKYVGDEVPSNELIFWLIANGVPDANLHIKAKILLMDRGKDETGYWWLLVTKDDYWTNRHNRDTYDFGMHVHSDGTIRLMNPKLIGNKDASTATPEIAK